MKKRKYSAPEVMRYRWEFLRRWDNYISDYNKLAKNGFTGFSDEYWAKTYGILDAHDPNMSFEEELKKYPKTRFLDSALMLPPSVIVAGFSRKPMVSQDTFLEFELEKFYIQEKDKKEIQILKLELNIRDKKEKILKEFEEMLKKWRKICCVQNIKRNRYDNYDIYLQIYDLRKKRKTWREIAKVIYPSQYTSYSSSSSEIKPLTEKVKANYVACLQLIQGGYKEIIR